MNKHNNGPEDMTIDNRLASPKHTALCVVMPAYNEGENIRSNLLRTSEIISNFIEDYQIIAVNDGSLDRTASEIRTAAEKDTHIFYISYSENQGKGYAISTGVKYANADYIAFLDADMELNPVMLRYFLKALQATDADIAIGSKMHKKSRLEYPLRRRIISLGYFVLLKLLFNLNLKDTQTGIKLFKSNVIKPICRNLSTSGFAFDIEILATASKMGCKIIEMPITLKYSRTRTEKSKVSLRQIGNVFRDTLRIRKKLKQKNL